MKVSVIGTGYVGLVSGVCLAEKGHDVVCIDVDKEKIEKINNGIPPIYERNLEELLRKNINLNLKADTDLFKAVMETEISLIAVGTPFDGDKIDLSYIEMASGDIGKVLKEKKAYHMIVVKSTVVPGTTDGVVLPILEKVSGKKAGKDFGIGMNPEFLREGEAVQDFMFPDRIVMGAIDKKALGFLEELYRPFNYVDKLRTNNKTAEMIKYTSNSLLATLISFSNEIANLCSEIDDIDVVDVMKGVHMDKRLSPIMPDGKRITPQITTFIESGCGFGGSCFPKDVKALIAYGKQKGRPMQLLDAVIQINQDQPLKVMRILKKHFSSFKGIRIAILGLAFKPGTNDMRESPAIPIVKELLAKGAEIKAYDPVASAEAQKIFTDHQIQYCDTLHQTLDNVQAVVLLTRWDEFSKIPSLLEDLETQPLFIDGRRMLDKALIARYEGIGL
jgi:UDPglucose 6-dehydrogenase